MNPLRLQERELVNRFSWSFYGCYCQQNPAAIIALNRLLLGYDFSRIIELGTHLGGFSTLFALYCLESNQPISAEANEPALAFNGSHNKFPRDFYTFDNVCRDKNRFDLLKGMDAHVEIRDFLNNTDDIAYIKGLIPSRARTLLLCDGGCKKRELDIYAGSLRQGDVVMLHDWAYDERAFERLRQTGWTGWETRWENGVGEKQQFGIKDICEREGVVQIFPEEFDQAAWFAGIKT